MRFCFVQIPCGRALPSIKKKIKVLLPIQELLLSLDNPWMSGFAVNAPSAARTRGSVTLDFNLKIVSSSQSDFIRLIPLSGPLTLLFNLKVSFLCSLGMKPLAISSSRNSRMKVFAAFTRKWISMQTSCSMKKVCLFGCAFFLDSLLLFTSPIQNPAAHWHSVRLSYTANGSISTHAVILYLY
jgi:hypothetical protein